MSGVSTATILAGVGTAASVGSAIAGIAGAGTKAAGQVQAGQVQAQQANYQADIADYNGNVAAYQAQVAQNNALTARMAGERTVQAGLAQSAIQGLQAAATVGKIKAGQAANNIDVNTGSAVEVRADAAAAGKVNAETTLSNAQLQNWGYRATASNYEAEAGLQKASQGLQQSNANFYRSMAGQAQTGANIGAVGTLLDAASSLPLKWIGALGPSDSSGATAAGPQGSGPGGDFTTAEGASMMAGAGGVSGDTQFADVGSLLASLE